VPLIGVWRDYGVCAALDKGGLEMVWNLTRVFGSVVLALLLFGCEHREGVKPRPNVEIAKNVCEVTALAQEHRTLTTRIGNIENGAPTNYTDEAWTILREKLSKYRAEIDATYRFVTSNCTSYNLCMQMHNYSEQACASSRVEWTRSNERFNELSVELAKIDVPNKTKRKDPDRNRDDHCRSRCNLQGSVFSTSCCKDPD